MSRLDRVVEVARCAAENFETRPVAELAKNRNQHHCRTASLAMKLAGN